MTDVFSAALAFILGPDIEGGFGCDPRDPGNWTSGRVGIGHNSGTKFGISAAAYPQLDIANLTINAAKAIYKKDYWDPIQGDHLGRIAFLMFDEAVNAGPRKSVMLLQSALDIEQDGAIGHMTLEALEKADQDELILKFTTARIVHYTLCNGWTVYKNGWTRRAVKAAILATNLKTGD